MVNRNVVLEGCITKKAIEAKVYTIDNTREVTLQTVAGKYKFSLSNVVYAKLAVQSVSGRPKDGDSGGVIYDKSTKKNMWRASRNDNYYFRKHNHLLFIFLKCRKGIERIRSIYYLE